MFTHCLWRRNINNKWIRIRGCFIDTPCCASNETILPIGINPNKTKYLVKEL